MDSSAEAVEPVAEIKKRIEKGVEIFGAKSMLLNPDCGLRMRSRNSAFWKLKNMAEAAREVRLALQGPGRKIFRKPEPPPAQAQGRGDLRGDRSGPTTISTEMQGGGGGLPLIHVC